MNSPRSCTNTLSAFTPGTWEVWRDRNDNSVNVSSTRESGSQFVCLVGRVGKDTAEHKTINADAHLIAAAKDLLAACERAIYDLKGREHDGYLRDAIAKARGKSGQANSKEA